MKTNTVREYGRSIDVSVARKTDTDALVLSGVSSNTAADQWARLVTRRAAHLLWYRLTWALFPGKSAKVTGLAATAPLITAMPPTVTTHIEIVRIETEQAFNVAGLSGSDHWQFQIDDKTARQLWATLDIVLYPAGWEGANFQFNKAQ